MTNYNEKFVTFVRTGKWFIMPKRSTTTGIWCTTFEGKYSHFTWNIRLGNHISSCSGTESKSKLMPSLSDRLSEPSQVNSFSSGVRWSPFILHLWMSVMYQLIKNRWVWSIGGMWNNWQGKMMCAEKDLSN
jgi:hypothetical protein